MKRKGYQKWYDKNDVHMDAKDLSVIEKDSLEHKYEQKKKRLKVNVIEFIIGVLLLWFCWGYLQTHPAEEVSLFTGVEVIVQKAKIWLSAEWESLKIKYELERSFDDAISLAGSSECIGPVYLAELKKQYKALKAMSTEEFIKEKSMYQGIISLAYRKIKKNCEE